MKIGAYAIKYIIDPIKRLKAGSSIDTMSAIKTYNESLSMLVDDFTGVKSVPNSNLKVVYDRLMVAYSQILATRRIDKKTIKYLKKLGVSGMEWAHIARLSDADRANFVKNISCYPKSKLVQMAAYKNNAGKIMLTTLSNPDYKSMLKEMGVNIEKFRNMLICGNNDLFTLDIIRKPLNDMTLEAEPSIGLRMIRRIVINERKAKLYEPEKLLPCFDKKILNQNYKPPKITSKLEYYRNGFGYIASPMERYLDAFDRYKVLGLVDSKIKGRNSGIKLKERLTKEYYGN